MGITYFANKSRTKPVQVAELGDICSPPSHREMANAKGNTTLDDTI